MFSVPEIVLSAPGYVYQSLADSAVNKLFAYQVGFIEVVAGTVIALPVLMAAVKMIVSLINRL